MKNINLQKEMKSPKAIKMVKLIRNLEEGDSIAIQHKDVWGVIGRLEKIHGFMNICGMRDADGNMMYDGPKGFEPNGGVDLEWNKRNNELYKVEWHDDLEFSVWTRLSSSGWEITKIA